MRVWAAQPKLDTLSIPQLKSSETLAGLNLSAGCAGIGSMSVALQIPRDHDIIEWGQT
jgi:hypothetical protein